MQIPGAALLVLALPLVVAACGAPVRSNLPHACRLGRLEPGSSRSGVAIVDSSGKVLARIGDEVSIVGGEYQADAIGSQLSMPIPAACQTDRYWLAGDVTVVGSPAPSS